ncbi:MAG: hypothetical protein J5518_01440 [Lachnospiraceae bacterium]|nr:hypothetical protein [Lachnospiraceae bacterium]
MNKNLPKSKTALFLMELIIVILFFSIASAVCMQLFAKSHVISRQTKELNHAVAIAQSYAEVMRGTDGSMESILAAFPDAVAEDNYFEVFYDSDFNVCDPASAAYVSDVTITPNGAIQNMEIRIVNLSDYSEIYTLTATKYMNTPQG